MNLFEFTPTLSSTAEKDQVYVNFLLGNVAMIWCCNWPCVDGCRPFTVSPDSGMLSVGGHMQITVEYRSLVVGTHSTDMVLHYDTGQYIVIVFTTEILC